MRGQNMIVPILLGAIVGNLMILGLKTYEEYKCKNEKPFHSSAIPNSIYSGTNNVFIGKPLTLENPNTHIGPTEEDAKRFQKSIDNRELGYHEDISLGMPKGYMELGTPSIAIHSKHEPIVTNSNAEWIINFKDEK